MEPIRVNVECVSCSATGLYRGFVESSEVGLAVVCRECGGSGQKVLVYTPFTGRKQLSGVTHVRRSRGDFVGTGCGPTGLSITYEQFLAGRMP